MRLLALQAEVLELKADPKAPPRILFNYMSTEQDRKDSMPVVVINDEMVKNLEACGLLVERSHHEVGTAGQAEINYRFDTLLSSADKVMLFKYVIKNVAWANGKTVTFMPKPLFGDNGSGMHAHQSLWKEGAPLFYDEAGYGGLSDTARYYIGGLLHHAPSPVDFLNHAARIARFLNHTARLFSSYRRFSGRRARAAPLHPAADQGPGGLGAASPNRAVVQPLNRKNPDKAD